MIIIAAPNTRSAHVWCRDNGLNPYDREVLVVVDPDRLRGMSGDGMTFVVINPGGPLWGLRAWRKMSDMIDVVNSRSSKPVREVWA